MSAIDGVPNGKQKVNATASLIVRDIKSATLQLEIAGSRNRTWAWTLLWKPSGVTTNYFCISETRSDHIPRQP
jgi:hypothetical protein